MVFSSFVFLCIFLPVVLAAYFLCPQRWRNVVLLISSLIFYAWGEPVYLFLMLFSTVFDYANGRMIASFRQKGRARAQKGVLILSVAVNLGLLGFFKYTDFAIGNLNRLFGGHLPLLELALPIGISFYTFQTLSYTIDVYRGRVEAQRSLLDFAAYISMFPQLIAGPIVRYADVQAELSSRRTDWELVRHGVCRFLLGLGKKVLLANQIGLLYEELSGMEQTTTALAWLAIIAFTFQIYFDFSGYSDMAIGLGEVFGFHFPENFRYPYESRSITEFWRRWHISLGTWFREYLYIPLGGNRVKIPRQILNLLIVWALTGIWHGAGWNFLLWGLYYFVLLVLEKFVLSGILGKMPFWLRSVYTMFLVMLGWGIFATEDLSRLGGLLGALFGIGSQMAGGMSGYYWRTHWILLLICAIGATTLPKKAAECLFGTGKETASPVRVVGSRIALELFCIVVLGLSITFLVGDSYNPFLYFRF